MSIAYEQKAPDGLNKLGLKIAAEHLDSVGQRAAAESWSYSHFLGYLLEGELTKRHRKTVEFNLQLSHLPYIKKLEDFDFAAQPTIDRRLIDELATGRFLSARPKHCFSRPPGVGKTHLAISLALIIAELGYRIYFITAIDLARRMSTALAENRLYREIHSITPQTAHN